MASGTVRMVRRLAGDVLPDLPVAARGADGETPGLVAQGDGQTVDLGLEHEAERVRGSTPASAASLTTRAYQARSSSSFLALARESMGSPWRTWVKPASGSPPTRCVGESAVTSSG